MLVAVAGVGCVVAEPPSWHPSHARRVAKHRVNINGGGGSHSHRHRSQRPHDHKEHKPRPKKGKHKAPVVEATWEIGESGLGTYDTCDRCEQCILDDPPAEEILEVPPDPSDGLRKCKKCLGCNVVLSRMKEYEPIMVRRCKLDPNLLKASSFKILIVKRITVLST